MKIPISISQIKLAIGNHFRLFSPKVAFNSVARIRIANDGNVTINAEGYL